MENMKPVLPIEDPTFATKPNEFSAEYLQEWLSFLSEKTKQDMDEDLTFKDFCSTEKIVELIFSFCLKFNGPTEIRYSSVEIFDRFLVNHVQELHNEVRSDQKRNLQWEDVEEKLKSQLVLRILSCVQLASKLHTHYDSLTCKDVKDILKSAGYSYSLHSILCSELRVLRTLKYKISILTPLTYIEALLAIVVHNTQNFQPCDMYPIVVQMTDLFYLKRDRIYRRLYGKCTGEEVSGSPKCVEEYRHLKTDYLLLAASLILTAASFISDELQIVVGEQLHLITGINSEDVHDFSSVLLSEMLEESCI